MVSMDSRTLHGQRQSRGGEDHRQRQSEVLEDLEPRGPQTSRTSNLVLYLVCPIGRYWAFVRFGVSDWAFVRLGLFDLWNVWDDS